ncbi:hypothetical protein COO60DRAFT_1536427, partial [Scenedesmus sp. NREL 46B-D3]
MLLLLVAEAMPWVSCWDRQMLMPAPQGPARPCSSLAPERRSQLLQAQAQPGRPPPGCVPAHSSCRHAALQLLQRIHRRRAPERCSTPDPSWLARCLLLRTHRHCRLPATPDSFDNPPSTQ